MRLFLAITLPAGLRDELARRAGVLRHELPRATWVRPESMHLTLHFFGEREPARAAAIAAALRAALEEQQPFTLRTATAGAFPRASRPQVVWLGLDDSSALAVLDARVRETLRTLDEPIEDRPFHGHVTLLRCKARYGREHVDRIARALADLAGIELPVREATLFESLLRPEGAKHEVLARLPLGAQAQF